MKKQHQRLIDQYGPERIIDVLEPFLTERRKLRIHKVLAYRLNSLQLAIESPSDINNALAAIRTAEALGIANIHIISAEDDAASIHVITQGAFYWINLHFHKTLDDFLQIIKKDNIQVAGAIIGGPMQLSELPIKQALCLLMGNEQRGLSEAARSACDFLYHIPMAGMSESLNLSVSAAISLYDMTQRKRALLDTSSDLTPTTSQHLKAQYYLNSVNHRLIEQLPKLV